MADLLDIDTKVSVNFNNAQVTLCHRATVIAIPAATGDSWVFEDLDTGRVHYVSEGCTVTIIETP